MKSCLCVLVIVLLLEGVFSSVAQQRLPPSPDHPNQCYDPKTKEAHDEGATWHKPGECIKYSCSKKGNDYWVHYTGCGAVFPPNPPCKLVTDETKQHPDCCPKVEC